MDRMRRLARRAWTGPLAALLFMTGIAGPLLDSVRPADGPVWESRHAPGDCVPGHDHSLCTVIEGSVHLPAPGQASDRSHPTRDLHARAPADLWELVSVLEGHRPRAPPTT